MILQDKLRNYINFRDGNYIEIGAFDGIFQSNTKFLEDEFGWTGVLIEPSENKFNELVKNRPNNKLYNCACVSNDYLLDKIKGDFIGMAMSSIGGKRRNSSSIIEVDAMAMTSILDDSNIEHFNFLSLDVEGYELEVLNGLDLNKYKIDWVLIEIYNKDKDNIIKHMEDNGYELICNLSGYNHIDYPNWDGTHNDYLFKFLNE